jgi:hypothetical protein
MIQICLTSKASDTSNLPNEFRNSHARAVMNDAVLVTRDEDLRRKVEDVVSVKKPEDALKEIVDC